MVTKAIILGPSYCTRQDLVMSTVVELGIQMLQGNTEGRAAAFLRNRGVPCDVAVRVLTTPRQRRSRK